MTWDEWVEIVAYVKDRWPAQLWPDASIKAYFQDLRRFDPADVWSALYGLYESGKTFPPNGSELVAATREARKRKADPTRKGLPAPEDGAMNLREYLDLRGFDTFDDAVRASIS